AAGVPAGNPSAARSFADNYLVYKNGTVIPIDYTHLQDTINKVRGQKFQKTPSGASFYDNSKLWHAEVYYNFNKIKWAEIIAGGNFRQYSLYSNATIFDEAPVDKTNPKRIFINQYGAYVQISKTLAEKLKL